MRRRNRRRRRMIYNAKLVAVSAGMLVFSLHLQSFGQARMEVEPVKETRTEWNIPEVKGAGSILPTASAVSQAQEEERAFVSYEVPTGTFPEEIQIYTHEICEQYGIPVEIIFAMMQRESGFNSQTVGDNGQSFGYMQVMKKWHEERMDRLGVTDLMDPKVNILVAVDYLSELYEWKENMTWALMAYNCGPSTAQKLWDSGVTSTKYTEEVLKSAEQIRTEIYGGAE